MADKTVEAGLHCPSCRIPMERVSGIDRKWRCPGCRGEFRMSSQPVDEEPPVPRVLLNVALAVLLLTGLVDVNGFGASATGFSFGAASSLTDFERINGNLTEFGVVKVIVLISLILLVIFVPLTKESGVNIE